VPANELNPGTVFVTNIHSTATRRARRVLSGSKRGAVLVEAGDEVDAIFLVGEGEDVAEWFRKGEGLADHVARTEVVKCCISGRGFVGERAGDDE